MRLLTIVSLYFLFKVHSIVALECGNYNYPFCAGSSSQYSGGFNPGVGYGGFGGGSCNASKTPVIFIHGNGDYAVNWDAPPRISPEGYSLAPKSVYDTFRVNGYNDCELFGITYLSPSERESPARNYHSYKQQIILSDFITAVKRYTGKNQIDIVGHSLGVSIALSSLKRFNQWSSVRRFINIAGGIHGLNSCRFLGYANPVAPACGGQHVSDNYLFGLHPSTGAFQTVFGRNDWTGSSSSKSMRRAPEMNPGTLFYTVYAGAHDEIHCSTWIGFSTCANNALFNANNNVKAQLNVGAGSLAVQFDYNFSDYVPWVLAGGDIDGVGHFNARINTGDIIYEMLASRCRDLGCIGVYEYGPVQ